MPSLAPSNSLKLTPFDLKPPTQTLPSKALKLPLSICKPGYRSKARKQIEKQRWFKKLQRFRAGIEGIISVLMRAYGLKRCLWKGWEAFQSYVGLGIVTFNLQKIAQLT